MAGTITNNPFFSKYGFNAPGFSVDAEGNVTVKSLSSETLITDIADNSIDTSSVVVYNVTDDVAGFNFEGIGNSNPDVPITKGRTYRFNLDLTVYTFNIRNDDGSDVSTGIVHVADDGTQTLGTGANDKSSGYIQWTVPINASGNYYANVTGTITGLFDISEPTSTGIGSFVSLLVTGASELRDNVDINSTLNVSDVVNFNDTTNSTSLSSGALVVDGGVGIAKDVYIGGDLVAKSFKSDGVGVPTLESQSNLEFSAGNAVVITINNVERGRISADGINIPVINTTIENTPIGLDKPKEGKFTSASVTTQTKTTDEDETLTTKKYVDNGDIAYSIAFGA